MKKILLLLLLIPALLTAQTKEEKELEKRVKGMTKDKAEAILMQSRLDPPRNGGWELIETQDQAYIFKATDNKSNAMKLFALVYLHEEKLYLIFTLKDPKRLMSKQVLKKNIIVAKAIIPALIDTKKYTACAFQFNESKGALLNVAFVIDKSGELNPLNIGPRLVALQTIYITTDYGSEIWKIHNPEVLYAAALMLKPGLTYKEFLEAIKRTANV